MAEATEQCTLLSGWVAGSAQAVLACIVLASLLIKRHRERPQRPMLIWGMDVSKQIVSSGAAHVCGMVVAMLAQAHTAPGSNTSECSWYFVIFTIDTSLGVLLTLTMHRAAVAFSKRRQLQSPMLSPLGAPLAPTLWDDVAACGHYGSPPSVRRWAVQLTEFTLCVALARLCCGALVLSLNSLLAHIAAALDSLFAGQPVLLLFTVMVCCPLGMNMAQAIIQDQILRWRKASGGAGEIALLDAVEEGMPLDDAPKRRKAVGHGGSSSSRQSSCNSCSEEPLNTGLSSSTRAVPPQDAAPPI